MPTNKSKGLSPVTTKTTAATTLFIRRRSHLNLENNKEEEEKMESKHLRYDFLQSTVALVESEDLTLILIRKTHIKTMLAERTSAEQTGSA